MAPNNAQTDMQTTANSFKPYVKCFNSGNSVIIDTCMLFARNDEKPYFELGCLDGQKYKIYFVHKTDEKRTNFTAIRFWVADAKAEEGEIQLLNYKFKEGIPIFGCPTLTLAWTLNPETQEKVYYKISLTLSRMDNSDNPMWQYLFSVFYSNVE